MHPVTIVNTALSGAVNVWTWIVEATGMWSYYMSAIVMLLLLRYLLAPIFGRQVSFGGSSDMAGEKTARRVAESRHGKYENDERVRSSSGGKYERK